MVRVLQLIDSLDAGGAERLSVSYANALSHKIDGSFLCATRAEGILKPTINNSVGYLFLEKRSSLDIKAVFRLRKYIRANKISIIHAHSTSYFLATLLKLTCPKVKIVWHDHYGRSEFLSQRSSFVLRLCSIFFYHIFCVNRLLLEWSKEKLKCDSVSYVENFVALNSTEPVTKLKGESEKRILCLANLRPQKDHFTLIKAFAMLVKKHPDWTLHCVGKDFKDSYSENIKAQVKSEKLDSNIFFYGSCSDVNNIMSQCSIGVLSSQSEGLPITLLEYGINKLAVVSTDVGDCKIIIDSIDKGYLVPPQDHRSLFVALNRFIENDKERIKVSENLYKFILERFSETSVMKKVLEVYHSK